MQQSRNTGQPGTILRCEACGNDQGFDAVKTYFHKVVLNGAGLVESSRVQSDLEGEDLEITCRKCEAPVRESEPAPLYKKIEDLLQEIDRKRNDLLDMISASTEISIDAAEDVGVANCALTDAINEVREEMNRHGLYPHQDTTAHRAG